MIVTISTKKPQAMDLGYVFNKHPHRPQGYDLAYGQAFVFFPVAREGECSISLLLNIDPVGLVRRRGQRGQGLLEQYVNDRPYANSSFMSVAMAKVFTQALNGKCPMKPELVEQVFPLKAELAALPCRGGEEALKKLFEPLGYEITSAACPLDATYPQWGNSPYHTVTLSKTTTVRELLKHLYVLIPVLDNQKHYYVAEAEIDKLLRHGTGWLETHPAREFIARRYLKHQTSYALEALHRLTENAPAQEEAAEERAEARDENAFEKTINLNEQRYGTLTALLKGRNVKTVIDVGCGEGRFLKYLSGYPEFSKITGMDVSIRSLELAKERLHLDGMPERQRARFTLFHGSLLYRDSRVAGYDALTAVEVMEHLESERLAAFRRVVFEWSRIPVIIITTPNREYNTLWEGMEEGAFRHRDHRFEWTRREFQAWADECARDYGYEVTYVPIGPEDGQRGSPTQAAVFEKKIPATGGKEKI